MRKSYIIITLAMVASLAMVSCKNNEKAKEPTQEEVQEMKQALADTVLAKIDEIAEQYLDNTSNSFRLRTLELTDAEKSVKPDYLLDPSVANTLVTRSQKINALAIYGMEQAIRKIYDMPCADVEEAIARLIADIDCPLNIEDLLSASPVSVKVKAYYDAYKERGDLALFWQYENAILCETNYILAKNPELFFNKISEENLMAYNSTWASLKAAIRELAKYDNQMQDIMNISFFNPTNEITDEELRNCYFKDLNTAKETYKSNKLNQIEKRNALLQ